MVDYGSLIGQSLNEAREDLKNNSIDYRIIREGSIITADYKPERVNLHIDNVGKVTAVDMG